MIERIVLAEFDIGVGSELRLQFPDAVPGTSTAELAEYMITEGAHNFGVVSNFFVVGQNPSKELLSEQNRILQSPQGLLLDQLFTPARKQSLLQNFWVSQESSSASQGNPTRSVPDHYSSPEQEQIGYVKQSVKLYRIEDMQWKPYFQQGHERAVEFQITCQNSSTFKIKLVMNPTEGSSPLLSQSAQKQGSLLMAGSSQPVRSNNNLSTDIEIHPFLNFTATESQPHRASFENMQGYIYGIEIVNENVSERINLHQVMKHGFSFDPYRVYEDTLNQTSDTLFFFNVLKNRQNDQVKRGAMVKALAFGCKQKCLLEPLSQLIEKTLDAIFDATDINASSYEANAERYRKIIFEVYHQTNRQAAQFLIHRGNLLERAISMDLNTNCAWKPSTEALLGGPSPESLFQTNEVTVESVPIVSIKSQVIVPLASPPDQITSSSLCHLIKHFGQQTMIIYDAILSNKRIIFAGSRNLSITHIQNFMFAAASMVSPPLYGIHNRILPYVPLVAMDSLMQVEGGFLAGVTNPMFVVTKKLYDVSIQIDEGKLNADSSVIKEPYYELDKQFIKTLLVRIHAKTINDEEIRQAFHSYTQLMLDLAPINAYQNQPDSAGVTHNGKPLAQMYINRTRRLKTSHLLKVQSSMQKLFELDKTHGISAAQIKGHLRTLRIKGVPFGPLTDQEVANIYKDIDTFVQDKQSVLKLLYLLPACRQGVGLIAHGLFYDSDRVQHLTVSILNKIQRSCKVGALAVNRLSEFLKMRYIDIQNEIESF